MMSTTHISLGIIAVFLNAVIFSCALIELPRTLARSVIMVAAIITEVIIGFPIIHAVNQMNLN